jgi:phosphoserine phosphatase RsbU/P
VARALRLLVVDPAGQEPLAVREVAAAHSIRTITVRSCRRAAEPRLLSAVNVILMCPVPRDRMDAALAKEMRLLAGAVAAHRLTGLLLHDGLDDLPPDLDVLVPVPPDVSADELWGRLATIQQHRPLLKRLEDQVEVMKRLGAKLNQHFADVDQELRLASRLQRDFLPKTFPEVGDVRFSALYRPATWVSGDVYDVRRLDETHVGFYLADAVGHGVAAGLLTMFIRQAVIWKRTSAASYTIVAPSEVLEILNDQLADQDLPNCQFVTGCYGTIDTASGEVQLARGGHPHPLHVSGGRGREVHTAGGLLGVFPGEKFPGIRLFLKPGDKLILYSDGMEDAIVSGRNEDEVELTPSFQDMIQLPAEACLSALATRLDQAEGSLQPCDDQTCLIIERALWREN